MTPDRQRIALAELCGWKWYRIPSVPSDGDKKYRTLALPAIQEYEGQIDIWKIRADGSERVCNMEYMAKDFFLPDYLNDANAMREALVELDEEDAGFLLRFLDALHFVIIGIAMSGTSRSNVFRMIVSTPAQQAEAALRACGKWEKE